MSDLPKEPRASQQAAESIVEFKVGPSGTLRMADFTAPRTRAEFYLYVGRSWSRAPKDLARLIAECEPLGWAVGSIQGVFRAEMAAAQAVSAPVKKSDDTKPKSRRTTGKLDPDPAAPAESPADWLLVLSDEQFKASVVPEIEKWLGEPPDWRSEGEYLPSWGTAEGAAVEFFEAMTPDELEQLGVEIIEGDHPGSSYYAAELVCEVNDANHAAREAGIAVRFVEAED